MSIKILKEMKKSRKGKEAIEISESPKF